MASLYSRMHTQLVENRDNYLKYPAIALARVGVSPTLLNFAGMLLGILTGLAIVRKAYRAASRLLFLSSLADVLDGPLARETKVDSRWGEVLDASCDRVVDLTIYSALLTRSALDGNRRFMFLSWLNLVIDTMRSYVRARAEASLPGERLDFKIGILPRAGKVALLFLGLSQPRHLEKCLLASVPLSMVTLLERGRAAYQTYQADKEGEE